MTGLHFFFAAAIIGILIQRVEPYPIIAEADEGDERCFRFNIPKHDEAHLVLIVVPGYEHDLPEALESWYVDQAYKMTKLKTKDHGIPKKLPEEQPNEVAKAMSDFLQTNHGTESKLKLKITDNPHASRPTYSYVQKAKFFSPVVVNHIHKQLKGHNGGGGGGSDNLGGYGICLENNDNDHLVHVILDIVLVSEDIGIGEEEVVVSDTPGTKSKATDFEKEKHLTPLERSLDQSISSANAVIREMKYMEKREARMRLTADSINSRVRWFSYLSISVLLVVTYLQVTYLKRYFHKKKLM